MTTIITIGDYCVAYIAVVAKLIHDSNVLKELL